MVNTDAPNSGRCLVFGQSIVPYCIMVVSSELDNVRRQGTLGPDRLRIADEIAAPPTLGANRDRSDLKRKRSRVPGVTFPLVAGVVGYFVARRALSIWRP